MKKISIKYNPYLISTQIEIEGHELKKNSSLLFERQRLQEWADKLPDLLKKECKDVNFQINFRGTHADFEDIKLAFELRKDDFHATFTHTPTADFSEVEKDVDKIFAEIRNGEVEELRTPAIIDAFEKAKNQEFEINVIATMSSGKSTLINALLGKQLMPARVEATTATVVRITNADQDHYSVNAFDSEGKELKEYHIKDAIPEQIDKLNDIEEISTLEIRGRIPFVSTVGMQLVLVDTPGPNNARNKNHEKLTYEMLEDSDKSLVLYILNGEQLGINDNEKLLDYVCKCMKDGGKQSRDRYLFVVNKLDVWKLKEAHRIEGKLAEEQKNLEDRGIFSPCLFPTSAQAAVELRTNEDDIEALTYFKARAQQSKCYHFEDYYRFNHLPMVVKNRLQTILDQGDPDRTIEIHTGIVSVEQAISLYVNKYARATKIKDLVDSFNDKLNDLAAMENLMKAIREDQAKKAELEAQIAQIRENLSAAKDAKKCSNIIKDIDLTIGVKKMVQGYVNEVLKSINSIIADNNSKSVDPAKALKYAKKVDDDYKSALTQLQVKIEKIISKAYDDAVLKIVNEYQNYLKQLNISVNSKDFAFSPLLLISDDLKKVIDANKLIEKYKSSKKEKYYEDVTKTRKVEGNRVESTVAGGFWGTVIAGAAVAADCVGGCGLFSALAAGLGGGALIGAAAGDGDSTETYIEKEERTRTVTVVNMSDVVVSYFMPRQKKLSSLPDEVVQYISDETVKLKTTLIKQLEKIDELVEKKLEELSNTEAASNLTAEEIKNNERKLKWLRGIQERVNKLIMF